MIAVNLKKEAAGFTLLELVIVIAIIGTLAAIAVPIFSTYIDRVKVVRAISDIRTMEGEITSYNLEYNQYPNSLKDLGLGEMLDPYGNPYQYMPATASAKTGKINTGGKPSMRIDQAQHPVNTDYDLYSMGKDGKTKLPFTAQASQDDIVRANNGRYIGLVSGY